jgi:transposase InsO family protein
MTERMKFVARLLEGERMSDVCKDFGISRKTGYKIYSRFQEDGMPGLADQSRSARSRPNQTEKAVERAIIHAREEHPTWGAPKIKSYLQKRIPDRVVPARSTIHSILERHSLVKKRRPRSAAYLSKGTDLIKPGAPNSLWCADFKGQFKLGNSNLCYPLTVTDQFSRYLLACEALEDTKEDAAIEVFNSLFREYGIPAAIRSDNGVPFASASLFGLSRLSVYWLRLGIRLERIQPGHPEQNGSHERMHKTLKAEATKPPCSNILSQQERFDSFRNVFNAERPHQGIEMKTPADLYVPSEKRYNDFLEPLDYPEWDYTLRVSKCGAIQRRGVFRAHIGRPFAGQNVGVTQVEEDIWRVSFMHYDLGFFDSESQQIRPVSNPFLMKSG